ncbi:DUF3900 domain-containing protein [Mangrovibacillus cuniculi]|uniref:DUF3900 domain-containing protein n=1 Tax=Mangrovibacillus cuniculi TaxID=2593652 RepID=A0A7S8CAR8_9BACI|nr:DUF3900 domain-containing protein [Mangrovibacillus cuniculi]QPC46497.1 DUF3900 domain-containing protein [Mangrovibacillus cuniculi]
MEFDVKYASFFVLTIQQDTGDKRLNHFQTLHHTDYQHSSLKEFLDGELAKIVKRKAERHPKSDTVPTKIGTFIIEPDQALESNPNFNAFQRIRHAGSVDQFMEASNVFAQHYADTTAVRGGAFIVITASLPPLIDTPMAFILKCDFEPKVARISDEKSLLQTVEMAITTKNMKSIQYPHMPEEGIVEDTELKVHQASHARYFEDFLKFVEYGDPIPVLMKQQVVEMVQEQVKPMIEEGSIDLAQFEQELDVWDASETRELQERIEPQQIVEAASRMVEQSPELELKMRLGDTHIKGKLADFGEHIHIAKVNNRYMVMIEADTIQFDKGVTPIEFMKPDDVHNLLEWLINRN